jgi:hypothetical protein
MLSFYRFVATARFALSFLLCVSTFVFVFVVAHVFFEVLHLLVIFLPELWEVIFLVNEPFVRRVGPRVFLAVGGGGLLNGAGPLLGLRTGSLRVLFRTLERMFR